MLPLGEISEKKLPLQLEIRHGLKPFERFINHFKKTHLNSPPYQPAPELQEQRNLSWLQVPF